MMSTVLICLLVGTALSNNHLNDKYNDFLDGKGVFNVETIRNIYSQFRSPYNERSEYRFHVFLNGLIEIREHNSGKHSWKMGINDFADMTFEELKASRLMAPQDCSATNSIKLSKTRTKAPTPDEYEWNDYGVVTPVKDQGSCGSCWTFSTIGAMESHWNILGKGKNITFAEQQLVDCAGDFKNYGCNGGLPSQAFEYIRYAGGLETDATYVYTAKDGQCKFRPDIAVGYCHHGSYNITTGDEGELADKLYAVGPISIAFQVISDFGKYKSGVYTSDDCGTGPDEVNHAVLATGFGTEDNLDFWNVKNSWGSSWGANGYFKIERGVNMCAVAQCNAYPLIDRENTSTK